MLECFLIQETFKALNSVDFFVNIDLFMTDTSKYADILYLRVHHLREKNVRVIQEGILHIPKSY